MEYFSTLPLLKWPWNGDFPKNSIVKKFWSHNITVINQGFFQQFWEKAPGQNWEKMTELTTKLGEILKQHRTRVAKYILEIKLF